MLHLLSEWGLPDKRHALVSRNLANLLQHNVYTQGPPVIFFKKCYGFVQIYAPDVYV